MITLNSELFVQRQCESANEFSSSLKLIKKKIRNQNGPMIIEMNRYRTVLYRVILFVEIFSYSYHSVH
jgi:hypothetical protein